MENYFKKLLFVATVFCSTNVVAQAQMNTAVDESQNFVYFYSDSILYADHVRLRTDFLNNFVLRADRKRIPLQGVKFFNTNEGFFANMSRIRDWGKEQLSERVMEGKINIFQERPDKSWFYGGRHRPYRNNDNSLSLRMYYNKGYDDLKKINYHNLKLAMTDDVESIDLLEGYRKSVNASKAMYIAAGASISAALISFLVTNKRSNPDFNLHSDFDMHPRLPHNHDAPRFTTSYILLGTGVGFAIGGAAIQIASLRKLEATVDHYNR